MMLCVLATRVHRCVPSDSTSLMFRSENLMLHACRGARCGVTALVFLWPSCTAQAHLGSSPLARQVVQGGPGLLESVGADHQDLGESARPGCHGAGAARPRAAVVDCQTAFSSFHVLVTESFVASHPQQVLRGAADVSTSVESMCMEAI